MAKYFPEPAGLIFALHEEQMPCVTCRKGRVSKSHLGAIFLMMEMTLFIGGLSSYGPPILSLNLIDRTIIHRWTLGSELRQVQLDSRSVTQSVDRRFP
jgi:hypothetical protein